MRNMAQSVTLLTYTEEILVSNIGRDVAYSD
jgi:hypothetical protein